MELKRKVLRNLVAGLLVISTINCLVNANIATFEDINLPEGAYINGSDGLGGFISDGITFSNNYNFDFESWDGFSCSNINDNLTEDMEGQYNAITGAGQGYTSHYAICYIGFAELPFITLENESIVYGLYVTNNNTAYYSMLNGAMFSKQFGGNSGDDPDWFMLTITGKDANGIATGTIEFYLADYRFTDNQQDYIIDKWEYIDLESLGKVKTLEFNLSSSDTGDWGMNTPAYFALDTIITQSQILETGPYNEAGIYGYIDPLNQGQPVSPDDANAYLNPIFKSWATEVIDYYQCDGVDFRWSDPNKSLGVVTGNANDIFSLGDLSREQVKDDLSPGWITLGFDEPVKNVNGYDFAVFENALISESTTTSGSVAGQLLAELAYVEVSSNGHDFIRFPSVSLTEKPGDIFGTIEPDKIYNLAGKHPNSYGTCEGTPFDLDELATRQEVITSLVDINDIRYIRIIDIPGTGDFYDSAEYCKEPNSGPEWTNYPNNHPVFDEWNTSLVPYYPSGGFDLEAIGILNEQQYSADIDLNGIVDIIDLAIFVSAWNCSFGQPGYIARCDLAEPKDNYIDTSDFDAFMSQYNEKEQWYIE